MLDTTLLFFPPDSVADLFALFIGLVFLFVVAVSLPSGLRNLWLWWQLRDASVDSIAATTAGDPVILEGEVQPAGETVEAPFSGEECLGYSYRIVERRRNRTSNGTNTKKVTLDAGSDVAPFYLATDEGTVLVEPDGLSLSITDDTEVISVGKWEDPPPRLQRFIEENDVEPRLSFLRSKGRRRFVESRLVADETAFVGGILRGRGSATGSLPRDASAVVTDGDAAGGFFPETPAMIADSPISDTASKRLRRGAMYAPMGVLALVLLLMLAF